MKSHDLFEKQVSNMWSIVRHGIKYAILENLSTTTNFLSLFDLCKPNTKSIDMSVQGLLDIGKGVYKPWGLTLDLAFYKL